MIRARSGSAASTSAVSRSVTVGRSASAPRSASASSAALKGRSAGFSRVSNSRLTCSSTGSGSRRVRSEEHTSELQSHLNLVCRLLLEKKKKISTHTLVNEKNKTQQNNK